MAMDLQSQDDCQLPDFFSGPVTDPAIVPCFTPGTAIATPRGEVSVESLRPGDRVLTRDHGIQKVAWISKKRIDHAQMKEMPTLRPILIRKGALGDGMPERDMLVSPAHRMLITSEVAKDHFDRFEVLIAAKHLLAVPGVEVSTTPYATYIHFMCAEHQIILADGAWTESFQPTDITLKGFDEDQRAEIFNLFPELQTKEGLRNYAAARRSLSRAESKLIFSS